MESSVYYSAHPVERLRQPCSLLHSLFELCVVVGMDEDTGLVATRRLRPRQGSSASTSSSDDDTVFNKEFEPSILAAISGQVVSFPQTTQPIEGAPFYMPDNVAYNCPGTLSPGKKSNRLRFEKPVELPLGTDVIFSLSQFCFPDGAFVYSSKQDDVIHTLVLTDIEGKRSYCSCLTFYKAYHFREDLDVPGRFLISCENFKQNNNGETQICYIPTCCCLISKYPYFHVAKDCLSSFLPLFSKNGQEMRESLMKVICNLCQVPIPPPGPISIEFELCGMTHLIHSAGEPKKRVIDMDYHLPFLCFSVDDILVLLSCILTQQRIIFLASNYSLLTPVIEALLSYIQPLLWSLTYVPVLPSNLIDLLDAPGSFIMGCDRKHNLEVRRLLEAQDEDCHIVCADIDDGVVNVGKTPIPLIPEPYRDDFKLKIKQIKLHLDLAEVSNVSLSDAAEMRKKRRNFYRDCANSIFDVCVELMLNLFSELPSFIKGDGLDKGQQVLFDRVGFVECKPEKHREFFRQLCQSHAFSTYLCERYEKDEVDFFSTAIKDQVPPDVHRKRSTGCVAVRHSRCSCSLSNVRVTLSTDEVFRLTSFVDEGVHTGLFYQNCIKDLNSLIQTSDIKGPNVEACYLYLRGMMYVANGQIYECLDDFFGLSSKSVQIFPTNSIVEIFSQFDVTALEDLKHRVYFRKLDILLRKYRKVAGSVRVRKQLIFEGVPRYPVGKEEFIERVMLCRITESAKTAERLSKVLTANSGEKLIHPSTFSDLYHSLNQVDSEAQSVDVQGVALEEREFVIKASSLCNTNAGVGRLLLTNIRLLFMADGSSSCKHLTRFLDISMVVIYQHYFLLPPGVPALKIVLKDKSQRPLFACLKTERDLWYCYLNEMCASHERAETLKDPQFISLGAQNVMLADALVKCSLPRRTALAMCYFTKTNEPIKVISGDTEKFLLQRLNPSERDTATTTVEALVYVPKFDHDGTVYPEQIWCGMGSGSIVIFQRALKDERWYFETQISCANDRVSCLLAVSDTNVWAGSLDATIYVFDRCSYKANRQLDAHKDIISAMFVEQQNSLKIVWSASLNGQIIGWNAETLSIYKEIRPNYSSRTFVSFLLIGEYFWCDTKSSIVVVNCDGEVKHNLQVKDGDNVLSIDCMIAVSSNQVWCACGRQARIAIFDTDTLQYNILSININENNIAFTKMALMGDEVWVGNRNGRIYTLTVGRKKSRAAKVLKTLKIHDDSVRSICVINGGYVATGPGSRDGKIAIWRHEEQTEEELGFSQFNDEEMNSAAEFQDQCYDFQLRNIMNFYK